MAPRGPPDVLYLLRKDDAVPGQEWPLFEEGDNEKTLLGDVGDGTDGFSGTSPLHHWTYLRAAEWRSQEAPSGLKTRSTSRVSSDGTRGST